MQAPNNPALRKVLGELAEIDRQKSIRSLEVVGTCCECKRPIAGDELYKVRADDHSILICRTCVEAGWARNKN